MARPLSNDKRISILTAATRVLADRGLGAPTSAISSAAKVAEGSLFTYFKNKDDLLNAVYREIKLEIADSVMSDFPRKKPVRDRLLHVWSRWVEWGVTHPVERKALRTIEVFSGLTAESKRSGSAPFVEIQTMAEEARKDRIIQDLPIAFVAALLTTLAETAMEFCRTDPERAELYSRAGFDMLWNGIARKRSVVNSQ